MTCLLLNHNECLQVLHETCVCYAAACTEEGPILTPLCFRLLDGDAACPVLLVLAAPGRMLAALRHDPRLCLAFSLLQCHAADSVLLTGEAVLGATDEQGATPVLVRCRSLSGRRFPLPLDVPLMR